MNLRRRLVNLEQRAGQGIAKLPVIYFQRVSRGADGEQKAARFLAQIPETPNGTPRYLGAGTGRK
jgi:hypothetical protein